MDPDAAASRPVGDQVKLASAVIRANVEVG